MVHINEAVVTKQSDCGGRHYPIRLQGGTMGNKGAQRGARGIMGCKWHKGVKDGHKEVEESHKIEFKGYRRTKATKGVQEGHRRVLGEHWGARGAQ